MVRVVSGRLVAAAAANSTSCVLQSGAGRVTIAISARFSNLRLSPKFEFFAQTFLEFFSRLSLADLSVF